MSFLNGLISGARTAFCEIAGNNEATNWLIGNYIGVPPEVFSTVWQNTIRQICNREPTLLPQPSSSSFTGGQCSARYRVTVVYRPSAPWVPGPSDQNTLNPRTAVNDVWGPIDSIVPVRTSTTATTASWGIRFVDRGGAASAGSTPTTVPVTTNRVLAQNMQSPGGVLTIDSISIVRLDGLPDDCGSPPPTQSPPRPPESVLRRDRNVTYTDSNNTLITIPVSFIFAPIFVDANLNVRIPVTIRINPTVNFNATFNVNTGGFDINFIGNYTINNVNNQFPPPPPPSNIDLSPVVNLINNLSANLTTTRLEIINQVLDGTQTTLEIINEVITLIDNLTDEGGEGLDGIRNILECLDELIRSASCCQEIVNAEPDIVASGTTEAGGSVVRLPIGGRRSILYALEVTRNSEFNERIWRVDENFGDTEATHGHAEFEYADSPLGGYSEVGLEHIVRQYSCLRVPDPDIMPEYIRLSLRHGLNWRVIDLGYVIRKKQLVSCF